MDTDTAGTRTDYHTGTGHFGKFVAIWMPIPLVPVQTFMFVMTLQFDSYMSIRDFMF